MVVLAEYKNTRIQAETLAAIVAGQLTLALEANGHATLAVPGGGTPAAFLQVLSQANIEWKNISVMLTDERFVPENSERSNTRSLRTTLLQGPAAAATLVPLYREAARPEDVLSDLSDGIRAVLPLDVCVLGMGTDMHVASLFPEADRLVEALLPDCQQVLLPMRAPGAPEPRLTLTAVVLQAAKHKHLLFTGPNKLAAFKTAEDAGPTSEAPVHIFLEPSQNVTAHYSGTTEP